MTPPVIHWFRRDLRLYDNTALAAAVRTGAPVLPVFILDPVLIRSPHISLPRLAFLLKALQALDDSLQNVGSRLWLGYGDPRHLLPLLSLRSGTTAVYTNRDVTPFARKRDSQVEKALAIPMHYHDDGPLLPPGAILKDDGSPYTVFTPFKRKWLTLSKTPLVGTSLTDCFVPAPQITGYRIEAASDMQGISAPLERVPALSDWGHFATIALPDAGEQAAAARLDDFLASRVYAYSEGRDQLASSSSDDTYTGSSFLSPYLRFGMLSPRQAYWGARQAYQAVSQPGQHESVETWVSELVWRDFYAHILYHFPHVMKGAFRPQYDKLEWRDAPDDLAAWKAGMTGFPVVDAAMRQLQAMGWIPNRARMIVASFLTKDVLIDWREGERHFMDWLIDGDPAANNGGWQWSAGTGTDAQPYFRIFNPLEQSKKFDPHGQYIRRWIPELRDVPTRFVHAPAAMPFPPPGYPRPIVDHSLARERTLRAFKAVSG